MERTGIDPGDSRLAQPALSSRPNSRASGDTAPRASAGVAGQLTPQELQIALQVAEGKTNREVGAALFLSPKTVEFHLSRAYRKLGVRSRAAEAAVPRADVSGV